MQGRHTEFFGPDFARGPFASQRIDSAAVQIATAIAQLRAPVRRDDADILAHADFIRQLADRLVPDYAAYISVDVGSQSGSQIQTAFRVAFDAFSILELWLAGSYGGAPTTSPPSSIVFNTGAIVQTITPNVHYRVITNATGVIQATVTYGAPRTWYWAVTRYGRTFYQKIQFY